MCTLLLYPHKVSLQMLNNSCIIFISLTYLYSEYSRFNAKYVHTYCSVQYCCSESGETYWQAWGNITWLFANFHDQPMTRLLCAKPNKFPLCTIEIYIFFLQIYEYNYHKTVYIKNRYIFRPMSDMNTSLIQKQEQSTSLNRCGHIRNFLYIRIYKYKECGSLRSPLLACAHACISFVYILHGTLLLLVPLHSMSKLNNNGSKARYLNRPASLINNLMI